MSIRLVVVDDAPFIHEVLKHLEAQADFEIVGSAYDGEEALKIVRETKPDVVFMDIIMPKTNGIEATQKILKSSPQVQIVACSTADNEAMIMRALEVGCCDYVVKPFKAAKLIQVIHQAGGKRKGEPTEHRVSV